VNINATLIGQSISFLVFVWFCMKFVWPPITAALSERKDKIAQGLEAAERGMQSQAEAESLVQAQLGEAKQHASEIINQAQKRANEIVAKKTANVEGERIKTAAHAEVDREVNKAKEQLRGQVSVLAIAGAEAVLHKEVNAETHRGVLDELAAQL